MLVLQVGTRNDQGGGQKIMNLLAESSQQITEQSYVNVSPSHILKLSKRIRELKPDIIQSHGTRAAIIVRLTLLLLPQKTKHLYILHGFHLLNRKRIARWFTLNIERLLNKKTDALICLTNTDKNLILKHHLIQPEKIHIIKNGIDISAFNQPKNEPKKITIAHISRLHEPKDVSTVLKAIKKVPNVQLLIVGTGPLEEELKHEASTLQIQDRTNFIGFQTNIPKILASIDYLILSSKWEGCPLVILEAMAAKVPVIGSNTRGIQDIIVHEKSGLLFSPGNADDLAEKLQTIIHNQKLADYLKENAYEQIENHHSYTQMQKTYHQLQEELIK